MHDTQQVTSPRWSRLRRAVALCACGVTAVALALPAPAQDRAPAGNDGDAPPAIEDPSGSMAHYYGRLRAAARRQPGAVARMALYGESTNATDRVTSALRRRLQQRFGDAGKGWVPIAPGWPAQRHQDVTWSQEGRWRTWVVNRNDGPLSRYGLGGVVATNRTAHPRATFATTDSGRGGRAVSRYRLFYQAWPDGGDVALAIDSGAPTTLRTAATEVADRVHEISVSDGAHRLEVGVGSGQVRLYGVVMERNRPGAVVDGLMLVGAFTRVLLHFDPDHWQRQVALREVDLLAFWLGGNDSVSRTTGFSYGRYVQTYAEALRRARRGRPQASCLVVSVIDAGENVDGAIRTVPRVPRVVAAQRDAARQAGCAFFDLFEAAGGSGTMRRWRSAAPRLAEGDYEHLTQAGARRVGEILYQAVAKGYDDFVAAGGS